MAKSWYILQVFTGYEKKIDRLLNQMLEKQVLDSKVVTSVKVPVENVETTDKNGKKKTHEELLLPGYVMLEMDLPAIGWKATCTEIRRIQGVNGFVGTAPTERPRPISVEEARNILQQAGEIKGDKSSKAIQNYEVGDKVSIMEGPFANFDATVEDVDAGKNKLKVSVQIFGRVTPVELDVSQVRKI